MTEAPATDPETAAGPDSADTTEPPDGRRTWLMVGSLVVALAVLVGLTWVAGGFEQRTDLRTIVTPGTVIASAFTWMPYATPRSASPAVPYPVRSGTR